MNPLEEALLTFWGSERLSTIQAVKVGIAGAGGLGSNCAVNLVRSGINKLVIVDYDGLEASNINRQYYFLDQIGQPKVAALRENLFRINPDLELTVIQAKIDASNARELFAGCQAVVEAFDNPECKQLLCEQLLGTGVLFVAASGLAGWENIDTVCSRWLRPDFCLIGDLVSEVSDRLPPLAPRVSVTAAKEANAVLEWILSPNKPSRPRLPETDLYCLTAFEHSLGRTNLVVVRHMLESGIKIIQYREKDLKMGQKYRECAAIREMTAEFGAAFIINDDIHLALAVGADGIHIGQDDLPFRQARQLVGDRMFIGLSTHSPEQARAAVMEGADYIGVGPIYRTYTKKDVCAPVGLDYLRFAAQNIPIPWVAIGGIKENNVAEVVQNGARMMAMVTEIVGAENIQAKINAIRRRIAEVKERMPGSN
jgi:thiamine biosynthesis protein ThiF family 2